MGLEMADPRVLEGEIELTPEQQDRLTRRALTSQTIDKATERLQALFTTVMEEDPGVNDALEKDLVVRNHNTTVDDTFGSLPGDYTDNIHSETQIVLRWGEKLELTEVDREQIAFVRESSRLAALSKPSTIVAQDYSEICATIVGPTVSIGDYTIPLIEFLSLSDANRQQGVGPAIQKEVNNPKKVKTVLHRRNGYRGEMH